MGTINYYTSNYITLGIEPCDSYDLEKDPKFMEEMQRRAEEYGNTIDYEIDQYIMDLYEDDITNIKIELKKHHFNYFHISIEPGYYEGFSLNIENNFCLYFNDYVEKREAQQEITELKHFLIECAGLGMEACSPGWCTGYYNYKDTLKAIREAVREMRQEVQNIPTWKQYEKETA